MATSPAWPPKAVHLPVRYHDRTLEGFDPSVSPAARAGLEAARRFLAGDVGGLVLIGPPGAGKSHLAAAMARAEWERDHATWAAQADAADAAGYRLAEPAPPWWINVPELIAGMRRDIPAGQTDHADLAAQAGRYRGLVILDDAGRENVTDFSGEAIYILANRRYEAVQRTVLTSNLSVADLDAGGFGPVISRLAEGGELVSMAKAIDYRFRKPGSPA